MKVYDANTKFHYYWNKKTLESLWEEPEPFKQAKKLNEERKKQEQEKQLASLGTSSSSVEPMGRTDGKRELPQGWSRHLDPKSGYPYYWNEYAEEPSWSRPQVDVMLPLGWTEQFDERRRRRYFWNTQTKQTVWQFPRH